MQAKRKTAPELPVATCLSRRRSSTKRCGRADQPAGRGANRTGRELEWKSSRGDPRSLNSFGPRGVIGPIVREPRDNLIVLLGCERLSFANPRKEPTVGRAMAPNSRLFEFFRGAKSLGKRQ